jgi:hypothetical protein
LPVKRTQDKLGIPRATFYRWYERYRDGGPEAPADHRSRPDRVWNRIPDDVRRQIIDLALELPELSPRELAVRCTDDPTQAEAPTMIAVQVMANDAAVGFGGAGGYLEMNDSRSRRSSRRLRP